MILDGNFSFFSKLFCPVPNVLTCLNLLKYLEKCVKIYVLEIWIV